MSSPVGPRPGPLRQAWSPPTPTPYLALGAAFGAASVPCYMLGTLAADPTAFRLAGAWTREDSVWRSLPWVPPAALIGLAVGGLVWLLVTAITWLLPRKSPY